MAYIDEFRIIDLVGYLNGLNNIFDIVRVVNPKIKEVVYEKSRGITVVNGTNCYEHWNAAQPCENCISAKAMNQKETLTKIQNNGDDVFIVMAIPMVYGDDLYIVETIKDITEALALEKKKDMCRAN